jgi:outer membrane protein OmpA-like peptidoglycan-associated protein
LNYSKFHRDIFLIIITLFVSFEKTLGNVIGVDAQNFNATTSGLDFVTVQSSETLEPCIFNLGLFVNHAKNSLPLFKEKNLNLKHTDYITAADLNIGYGIMNNWDLGISFPQVLAQKVESDRYRGEYDSKGLTEVRINSKVRLFGNRRGGGAIIGTVNFNQIQNNPFSGINPGPTASLELAFDTTIHKLALGLNIGYRSRNPGKPIPNFPVTPFNNQYIFSAASSYHLTSLNTKIIGEIFGSEPTKEVSSSLTDSQSSLEGLLGFKHDITHNVALHVGGGKRLTSGVASPDYRAYGGLNVTLGPICEEESPVTKILQKKESKNDLKLPKFETIVLYNIMFAFDSYREVLPGSKTELKKIAQYLKIPPGFKSLSIEGHTDSMGTDEYNLTLSNNRASTIKKYMVDVLGLEGSKITFKGFGESEPIADNGNYQGRQMNRRVEFKIYR